MATRREKDQESQLLQIPSSPASPQARPDESLPDSQLGHISPPPALPAPTSPEQTEAEAPRPQAGKSPDSDLEITGEFPPMPRVQKRRSAAKKNLFGPPSKKAKKMDDTEGEDEDEEEEADISGQSDDSTRDADYVPVDEDIESEQESEEDSEDPLSTN
jgi:hypothetical protein